MNRYLLLTLCLFCSLLAKAQISISGTVIDNDSKEGVVQATVKLLKRDSTLVDGKVSDIDGRFSLSAPKAGKYILRITSVGYKDIARNIDLSAGKDLALGTLAMHADAIMLQGATIDGHAPKVVVKADTFQYNASAYRVPEGSVVEELVKRLPGAQVSDDGTITINGKEVKKILVDGKEFMTGDTKTAMKNLPTSIVEKVKAYDQQSDLSRITGIDDGEEQTVLDFGIKKGMNRGMFTNIDLGIGTKDRYAERLMGAYFKDKFRLMLFGNANNTNDQGFGRGGFGRANNGLNATKMIGLNFNYNDKDRLQMDGSVRWNHSDGDARTRVSTQNFVASAGSYGNSLSQAFTRSNSWDLRYRLEWQIDSLTNMQFRPQFTHTTNDGATTATSAAFNDDPYLYSDDPLENAAIAMMAEKGLMVNTNERNNISYTRSNNAGTMLQLNRRIGKNGRNVTLRTDLSYKDTDSKALSTQQVHLYQIMNQLGNDSTYQTNRYSLTPGKTWSYDLMATYSEPLWKGAFLQFSYKFAYSYSRSDRSTYDFSSVADGLFSGLRPDYQSWDNYLARLDNSLDSYFDNSLSRYSNYKTYTHEMNLMMRIVQKKYKLNFGVMLQPQRTHFTQDFLGIHADTTRTVTNWAPTLDFRYNIDERSRLRVNYRGTTTQPAMSDLLDITDDSDPLNITKGNPGLKPAFTHNFRLFYNGYKQSHQQSWMTFLRYSNTRNSISNMVTYDEQTGGRTTRPENINGNWNVDAAVMYNTSIDSAGVWSMNTFTNARYNHYVGYLSLHNENAQKNITRSTTLGERLSLTYRNSWLEASLEGNVDYTSSKNKLQPDNDLDTWQFAYGIDLDFTLPWNMSLSTDIKQNSRRGYNDASLNTNELVWNAQLSQSFLRSKALTVSVQLFDILHKQSTITRAINAMQRTDTEYNNINSYGMLKLTYRLNIFGKAPKDDRGPGFGGPGSRKGFGGPPPGGGRGGF